MASHLDLKLLEANGHRSPMAAAQPHPQYQPNPQSQKQIENQNQKQVQNQIDGQIYNQIQDQTRLIFDDETLTVQQERARFFRDLAITSPRLSGARGDEAAEVLTQAAVARWETHFLTHDSLNSLLTRLSFLLRSATELNLDNVFTVESRRAFLQEVCFGETKLSIVLAKDLETILVRHLPTKWAERLDREAPKRITVPSGSLINVQYPPDQTPFIEVRIQEIFGWTKTPKLGPQQLPMTIHLLSPNFRPVQVTSDLESFWRSGYIEVRKELRLRYPKHSWPEDPLNAAPEAKGRRRF